MNFTDYQLEVSKTAVYPNVGNNFSYPALGLGGESGEVLEKIKKAIRDDNSTITPERKEELRKELGDVLWYVAQLCNELDLDLGMVAANNIEKLNSRKERGTLQGSGDDR